MDIRPRKKHGTWNLGIRRQPGCTGAIGVQEQGGIGLQPLYGLPDRERTIGRDGQMCNSMTPLRKACVQPLSRDAVAGRCRLLGEKNQNLQGRSPKLIREMPRS